MSDLIPGLHKWLDGPYQRDMDQRAVIAENEEEEPDDESADEDLWEDYP